VSNMIHKRPTPSYNYEVEVIYHHNIKYMIVRDIPEAHLIHNTNLAETYSCTIAIT